MVDDITSTDDRNVLIPTGKSPLSAEHPSCQYRRQQNNVAITKGESPESDYRRTLCGGIFVFQVRT
jgi:hypothetical protein